MAEQIKIYLDEDTISRALIKGLRAREIDILTAKEAKLLGASDKEQLAFASSEGRTVFTFNTRDFAILHAQWLAQKRNHAGIIVSDQIQVGLLIRRLLRLIDAKTSDDMQNWFEFLSNWR